MKSGVNQIAGGYTSVPWTKAGGKKTDSEAVLFSVKHRQRYPVQKKEYAVYHSSIRGPVFNGSGGGWSLCFGYSGSDRFPYSNFDGTGLDNFVYKIPAIDGKSALTGEAAYRFTLKEAEVFLIEH